MKAAASPDPSSTTTTDGTSTTTSTSAIILNAPPSPDTVLKTISDHQKSMTDAMTGSMPQHDMPQHDDNPLEASGISDATTTTTPPKNKKKTVLIPVTDMVSASPPDGSGVAMIRELSFAGNQQIMQDVKTLRVFLRSAPFRTLTSLSLRACRLGNDGLHQLVEALAEDADDYAAPALERLDLSDNRIASDVFVTGDLSRLIKLLPNIKEINLRSSDESLSQQDDILQDDDKTRLFVHAHFQNTSTLLEKLHLSSNDADALFVVEYTVSTTLERNQLLQKAAAQKKKNKAATTKPAPSSAAPTSSGTSTSVDG